MLALRSFRLLQRLSVHQLELCSLAGSLQLNPLHVTPQPSSSMHADTGATLHSSGHESGSQWHAPVGIAAGGASTSPQGPWQNVRQASTWAFWRKQQPAADSSQQSQISMEATDSFPQAAPTTTPGGGGSDLPAVPSVDTLSTDMLQSAESIQQACDALEHATIAATKSEAFFTTALFIDAFDRVHTMGLPWWAALAAVNVTTRVLMSPAILLQQRATAKMLEFNVSMTHAKQLQQQISKATTQEEQQRLSAELQDEFSKQVAKHGHPVKTVATIPFVLLASATVFISIFSATSLLMESKAPSLTTGGMLWFHDLTVPDAYYGLPVMCCLVTLAMIEYGISLDGQQSPMMQRQAATFKWMMRALSLVFIPTGGYVPAGVAVLWVSNTAFGVTQGFLFRNAAFRKMVGLPSLEYMKALSTKVEEAARANSHSPFGAARPPSDQPPPPGTPPKL